MSLFARRTEDFEIRRLRFLTWRCWHFIITSREAVCWFSQPVFQTDATAIQPFFNSQQCLSVFIVKYGSWYSFPYFSRYIHNVLPPPFIQSSYPRARQLTHGRARADYGICLWQNQTALSHWRTCSMVPICSKYGSLFSPGNASNTCFCLSDGSVISALEPLRKLWL